MKMVGIAFRNILRNRRRSAMTILAAGVGALSVLLFGGFHSAIVYGMQTRIVQMLGHLIIAERGYFDYGSSDPNAYSISRYEEVERWIREDPQLKDLVEVVTPGLVINGIAGNSEADASVTFVGVGVVPSDRQKMRVWNDYKLRPRPGRARDWRYGITDDEEDAGVIGIGMARMLGLCEELDVPDCEAPPEGRERTGSGAGKRASLNLLAAAADGAPNVAVMVVNRAENRGDKAMDDSFINMHLSLAQRLVFGKGEDKITEILVQLKHTRDIPFARAGIKELFKSRGLDLDVKDFKEAAPLYGQTISFLASIFTFIALNMGVIVLFTIVNTMNMSVMERVNEIGTLRALGVRRKGIMRQFLIEGCLLGALGATIGCAAAILAAWGVNACGFTWLPSHGSEPIFLTVHVFRSPLLLPLAWLGLVLLAGVSSLLPARRAGRMVIVDALRHV
jgi:putative ABC transport system permease protein